MWKKNKFQKIAWIIWDELYLIQFFLSFYLLVGWFVGRDSISLILEEHDSNYFHQRHI